MASDLRMVAVPAPEAHDPLTSEANPPWLVTCSCGWGREASSEWAAKAVSQLHQQFGELSVKHATRIEGRERPAAEQLPLI